MFSSITPILNIVRPFHFFIKDNPLKPVYIKTYRELNVSHGITYVEKCNFSKVNIVNNSFLH